MNIATEKTIVVDYKQPTQHKTITFLQYDTNIINFVVEDNGEAADLSNITKIVVNFKRPDRKVITQELTAVGNKITYQLTDSEMLKPGGCELVLQLYDDEERLSIARMKVNISENIESGEALTDEEIRLVTQLVEVVNGKLQELSNLEKGAQGEKGEPFRYSDFTSSQLESLRGLQGPPGPPGSGNDERLDSFLEIPSARNSITNSANVLYNSATTTVVDANTINVTITGATGGYAGFSIPYDATKRFLAVYKITNIGTNNIASLRGRTDYRNGITGVTQELGGALLTPTLPITVGQSHQSTLEFTLEPGKNRTHASFGFYTPHTNMSFSLELKIYDVTNLTPSEISVIDWVSTSVTPILKADFAKQATVAESILYKGSNWRGKRWLTLGDSITSPGTYQNLVRNKLGFSTVVNRGIAGQSVLGMLNNVTDTDIQNTDLITLYGCFNNFTEGAPRLGEITDAPQSVMSGNTFISNLKYVIEYVLTKNPTATFVIIGTHNGQDGARPDLYQPVNGTHNIGDYTEAMGKIARYYALPFIDMYGKSGINGFSASQYTSDGLHLNALGYQRIASIITGELQQIEPI